MLTFFAVVAAVYAAECVFRVENGAVVLTGARRKQWQARIGPMLALGRKGGVSIAPLLPPLATPAVWPAAAAAGSGSVVGFSQKQRGETAAVIDRFYAAAEPVWLGANTLWVFLFCVAPAVVYWRGLAATWPVLLLSGLAILGFTLHMFWRAYGALYPEARAERRSKTLLMTLSPLGAVRAVDHLSWQLLAGMHPLVAAVQLCGRPEAVRLARWMYFAPPVLGAGPDDTAVIGEVRGGLRRFLEQSGLWEAVVSAPEAGDPGAMAFCPRCHAQYSRGDGECSDCAGVGLVQIRAA